ncbi:hypothetical protein KIN20_020396 [Parelaphostrongylus tenuis]|uniref:Uncharacterized protein n=1 Tax=Parelaphostrongylus tenuis TaxID=148309 RepID=A0AAD5N9S6_PARTN|nr:hypothetical protein KIN20_020396 [Parelaphostrongylus tenuis]
MKKATAAGPDDISSDLLRTRGNILYILLATHVTSFLQKKKIPSQYRTLLTVIITRSDRRVAELMPKLLEISQD